MNTGQDELDVALAKLAKARAEIVERIARGVTVENAVGGYINLAGTIAGLDTAEAIFRDAFRGWLPPVDEPKRRTITEY